MADKVYGPKSRAYVKKSIGSAKRLLDAGGALIDSLEFEGAGSDDGYQTS